MYMNSSALRHGAGLVGAGFDGPVLARHLLGGAGIAEYCAPLALSVWLRNATDMAT